ncbi:hypothetical protein N658DRAFT_510020 [Parathielavia hyrcaniae]|uniref:Uncharacterized protein n=1 Tax=Parathielavia hyrcaniae TaxID=113614 RepID=A0AAN6PTV9_9PEZI|nr:hypothetical protein N658DRAFT_510020 [Parathielavia hyrcaniae]
MFLRARVTHLVVDAERRGKLPPKRISPGQLKHPEQPSLSELRAALTHHRFSVYLARCFCQWELPYPLDGDLPGPVGPKSPDLPLRPIVRALIIGAALAGTYREPLLKAKKHPNAKVRALPSKFAGDDLANPDIGEAELAYLLQFAVCDLEAPSKAQNAIFKPLSQWLLEDNFSDKVSREAVAENFDPHAPESAAFCQTHEDRDHEGCPIRALPFVGAHSDAHLVVWELMKTLWVVEYMRPMGYGTRTVINRSKDPPLKSNPYPPQGQSSSSAVVVFFGSWIAEEAVLPGHVPGYYYRDNLPVHQPPVDPREPYDAVFWLQNRLSDHSGKPNVYRWRPDPEPEPERAWYNLVPPLDLKFF